MDRQSAFTAAQSFQGFSGGCPNILGGKISEQEKTCGVGMPCHGACVGVCQHVKCGMFERVIAPGFENEGKVEDQGLIIS
jgi:hypothetical protein